MCGLAGMIGLGVQNVDLSAMRTLLFASATRGVDATGFLQGAIRHKGPVYEIDKSNMNVISHLSYNDIKGNNPAKIMETVGDTFYLAHLRAGTRGDMSPEAAHPYEFDNLVGMHNGTLQSPEFQHETLTDSYLLFEKMDVEGIEETLKALPKDNNAYALVMLDRKTNEIVITRNEKRTLYYCYNKARSVLYYASEVCFLRFMADRHGLNITEIFQFRAGHMYRLKPFDVNSGRAPDWKVTDLFPEGQSVPSPKYDTTTPKSNEGTKRSGDGNVLNFPSGKTSNERLSGIREQLTTSYGAPWDGEDLDAFDIFENDWQITTTGPKSSVIEKNDIDLSKLVKKDTKSIIQICLFPNELEEVKCIYCDNKMSLYEQYQGVKIDRRSASCRDCEGLAASVKH